MTQEAAGKALRKVLPYVTILTAGDLNAKYLLDIASNTKNSTEQLLEVYQQFNTNILLLYIWLVRKGKLFQRV